MCAKKHKTILLAVLLANVPIMQGWAEDLNVDNPQVKVAPLQSPVQSPIKSVDEELMDSLKKKADGGDTQAMVQIADMLVSGRLGKADPVQANQWANRAAQKGDSSGELFLAESFKKGRGTEDITDQEFIHIRNVAEAGDISVQEKLVQKYAYGSMGERDFPQAYYWISLVLSHPGSKVSLDLIKEKARIGKHLTSDQMKLVGDLVRSSVYRHSDAYR